MHFIPQAAQLISFAVFAWYGTACFVSTRMVSEFERYRLGRFRILTGILQVAASAGIAIGHLYPSTPILILSAGGLAVMMLLAVATRFRIRDPWFEALPAFFLFVINAYIVVAAVR